MVSIAWIIVLEPLWGWTGLIYILEELPVFNYLNVQDIILIPNITLKERNFIHKVIFIRLHPVSFFPFPVIFWFGTFSFSEHLILFFFHRINFPSYPFLRLSFTFLLFPLFILPVLPSFQLPPPLFLLLLPPIPSLHPPSYSLLPWSITTVGQADTNKSRTETHFLQPLSNESYLMDIFFLVV